VTGTQQEAHVLRDAADLSLDGVRGTTVVVCPPGCTLTGLEHRELRTAVDTALEQERRDAELVRLHGHPCPNAADLRAGHDDLCDLPEPYRRLGYVLNLVPGDHAWLHAPADCAPEFCKHAVWAGVVAAARKP